MIENVVEDVQIMAKIIRVLAEEGLFVGWLLISKENVVARHVTKALAEKTLQEMGDSVRILEIFTTNEHDPESFENQPAYAISGEAHTLAYKIGGRFWTRLTTNMPVTEDLSEELLEEALSTCT